MKTQLDMTEINEIKYNGYDVVSLFSGGGGSSLGYKLAGFRVKLASEFIAYAIATYRINHPGTIVIEKDIRDTTGQEILNRIGMRKYELDILDGSPPCASFSVNGSREESWGKERNYSATKQKVDDLFFEYARVTGEIMPKVFIAENVKGLTMGKALIILEDIVKILSDTGYNVEYKVLDASDYDVPQKRERTIIIGVRKDLNILPSFPKPSLNPKMTCKDAIEDLMYDGTDLLCNIHKRFRLMEKYFHADCTNSDIKKIMEENNIKYYTQGFRRDKWDEPYYTIKQHHTRPFHPKIDRVMSINEAKRIQTFPDDFQLIHSPAQNWERIGRAVPPSLMKHIALHVKNEILDKVK
jgi:DNA (cytosine-5)-methyltransferase 1